MVRLVAATILLLAASLTGACSGDTDRTSQVPPSPSLGTPSLVPSTTDWQESETYHNTDFGFSFDYDPSAFSIEELINGPAEFPMVRIIRDDSPDIVLTVIVLEPAFHSSIKKTVAEELERYTQENPGSSFSEPTTVSLHGRSAVALDWQLKAYESDSMDTNLRLYIVAGSHLVFEILLGMPEDQWPEAWPAYEGVIASFRAE
jgi:hypothetical protein